MKKNCHSWSRWNEGITNQALAYVQNEIIGHQLPSPNGGEPCCVEGGEAGGSAAEAAAPDQ